MQTPLSCRYSPAIALMPPLEDPEAEEEDGLVEEAPEATRAEAVVVVVANATVAANPATLLVTALVLAAEAAVETTALSAEEEEEEIRRLGKLELYILVDVRAGSHLYLTSYTCGGVGHLSRDCVQGSKCYNCSGVVSYHLLGFSSVGS